MIQKTSWKAQKSQNWKWRKDEWRLMKDEWRMMKDDDFKLLRGFALRRTDKRTNKQTFAINITQKWLLTFFMDFQDRIYYMLINNMINWNSLTACIQHQLSICDIVCHFTFITDYIHVYWQMIILSLPLHYEKLLIISRIDRV